LEEKLQEKDSIINEIVEDNLRLKKVEWGTLVKMWVEPEIRNSLVNHIKYISKRTKIPVKELLSHIELSKVQFYRWVKRVGIINHHNGQIPKIHWLTPKEKKLIEDFATKHYSNNNYFFRDGYRSIAYKMLDLNIVTVHPSSVYLILQRA